METKTSSIILMSSTIFPKWMVCDFTFAKSFLLNLDLKCLFTIVMASSPETRIIATAPTPEAVVRAMIVSLWYVGFVWIIYKFKKDKWLFLCKYT